MFHLHIDRAYLTNMYWSRFSSRAANVRRIN